MSCRIEQHHDGRVRVVVPGRLYDSDAGWGHQSIELNDQQMAFIASVAKKPCKSPYCECDPGKCTHPGCYDARGT